MSFESDLKRMEEITALLKDDKTGLEKSLELYEEALKISKNLSKTLNDVKRKIDKVTSTNEDELETIEIEDNFS